jgi:hypothetical protein
MRIKVCNYCGVIYNESRIRLEENYYNDDLIDGGELRIANPISDTPDTATYYIAPPEPVPNMRA